MHPIQSLLAALLVLVATVPMPAAAAGTLDRVKSSGKLLLGYGADERPLTFKDEAGKPAGFAIDLCMEIAGAVRAQLGGRDIAVEFVAVDRDAGAAAVAQGKVHVLCEATVPTMATRKQVSYSIPVFASGIGVLVHKDASSRLKDILSGRTPENSPTWRGNADKLVRGSTFAVLAGTRDEARLKQRLAELKLVPKVVAVNNYAAGADQVLNGGANAFFGSRVSLLDAAKRKGGSELEVLDRPFTTQALAFAVPRGDEDFRLLVDTALSKFIRSSGFGDVYGKWFGKFGEHTLPLFELNTLPE